jgi:hypothetical protein
MISNLFKIVATIYVSFVVVLFVVMGVIVWHFISKFW